MLYEDAVLGDSRTSQYSPSVGEGHFLILVFPIIALPKLSGQITYSPPPQKKT